MARWLPGIARGSLTATLAVAEGSGSWDLAEVAATAEPATGGWAVTRARSSCSAPTWNTRDRTTWPR